MSEQPSFGRWLKQRRKSLDLTQEELGARVGCARITIQKFELDQRRPSPLMAERLAEQLAIPHAERPAFIRHARGLPVADPLRASAQDPHHTGSSHPSFWEQQNPALSAPPLFVGRERELATLATRLDKVRHGQGQTLFITGDAGRGKTALVQEFAFRMQNGDPDLLVTSGSCNTHSGIGDPYLPFREALARLTGEVDTKDDDGSIPAQQTRRLRGAMPAVLPILVEHAPDLISTFVDGGKLVDRAMRFAKADARWFQKLTKLVSDEPTMRLEERRIFTQFAAVLKSIAAQRPLLLILEDLHWIDAASTSLLFHLSRATADSRILIVCTYRPDALTEWNGASPHPMTRVLGEFRRQQGDIWLDLDNASNIEGRQFIDAYLDIEPNRLDDAFRNRLLQQTGGNALFIVELLHILQENGDLYQDASGYWTTSGLLDWYSLPARVEGVIVQRIAGLSTNLQAVLTVASVEGELFTAEIVANVQGRTEREVIELLSRDLDRRHRLVMAESSAWSGTQRLSQYRFRHSLFQLYLYHHLDAIERAYWHEAIGSALERVYGAQIEQIAVKLAHHFRQAGLTEKAVTYLLRAGEHAQHLGANQDAIHHTGQGIALLAALPDSARHDQHELALQIVLGNALAAVEGAGVREVGDTFLRAEALCRKAGSAEQLLAVLDGLRRHYTLRIELSRAKLIAHEMLHVAQSRPNLIHHVAANLALGNIYGWLGELTSARMYLEQAISLYDPQHSPAYRRAYGRDLGIGCLANLVVVLWILGFPDQALQRSHDALTLAQTLAHPLGMANAHTWVALLYWLRHEPQEAQRQADLAIQYAAEQAHRLWWAMALCIHGIALVDQGQGETGLQQVHQGLDAYRQVGAISATDLYAVDLARIYATMGRAGEAISVLSQVVAEVGVSEHQTWAAEVYRFRGELLLMIDGGKESASADLFVEVETHFHHAIKIARRQRAKSFELRATTSLCRMWQAQGKRAEAYALLSPIYGWFTEGFDTPDLIEARTLLESLVDCTGG
ncbi:MAG: AAA family ATPase [Caldilineaceae bacterium]|nr:AAA family ATPase [Caldilineaceae bacterium]